MADLKTECINALSALYEDIDPRRAERLAMVYYKALLSMKKHDLPLNTFNDILTIRGIGPSIQKAIFKYFFKENKLEELGIPTDFLAISGNNRASTKRQKMSEEPESLDVPVKKRKKKRYVPKIKSGGYAILLSMLSQFYIFNYGMTKAEITEYAGEFCDVGFQSNPSTNEYYSAWSSMKTLISNDLVDEQNKNKKPQRYGLTDEGFDLAMSLKNANKVTFKNESTFQRKLKTRQGNTSFASADLSNRSFDDVTERSANLSMLLLQEKELYSKPKPYALPIDIELSKPLKGYSDNIIRARFNGTSYEVWDVDSFDVILYVDTREVRSVDQRDYFCNALNVKSVQSEIKNLSLADFVWIARHRKTGRECALNHFVERKRLDDLWESIKDNRFFEQKYRLLKSGGKSIFYLVEDSSSSDLHNQADAMKTSIWHTILYSGFHVERSKNAEDSVILLKNIHEIIKKRLQNMKIVVLKPRFFENQDQYREILQSFRKQFERKSDVPIECCHTFDNFQTIMGKRKLLTVKEAYLTCLLTVKGVSLDKAIAIQSIFPTLRNLLETYQKCSSEEEGRKLLFSATDQFPGNKKVGKILSEHLYEVFGR